MLELKVDGLGDGKVFLPTRFLRMRAAAHLRIRLYDNILMTGSERRKEVRPWRGREGEKEEHKDEGRRKKEERGLAPNRTREAEAGNTVKRKIRMK